MIAQGKNSITSKDLEIISEKDNINNIFDSVRTVLKSKNPKRIKNALRLESEPGFILEQITENIPREYEKPEEIEKAYDMVAEADMYLGRAFHTRHYGYWKYTYDLMGVGVALAKDETYKKFSRYASSTFYSKLSRNRGKRDLRDRVATKMGEKMHTSRKVAIEQFPYFEIMFEPEDLARDLADFFELDDAEVKQFRKRKIKKRKTKKVSKSKTKVNRTNSSPTKVSRKTKLSSKVTKKVDKNDFPEDSKSGNEKGNNKDHSSKSSSKDNGGSGKSEMKNKGDSGKSESKDNGKQVSLFSFK